MKKFKINDKINADRVHVRGRIFKKGTVYDPVAEKVPKKLYRRIMSLKMGELKFFIGT